MQREEVPFVSDWNHHNGCRDSASGFLPPGYFDVRWNKFLHRQPVSFHQSFLAALIDECLKCIFHFGPFIRGAIPNKGCELSITYLMDIVQIDVNRLLGGIQDAFHLLRNSFD